MKENKELTYTPDNKSSKKNLIIIIISTILVVVLISVIAYFTLIYNNDKNKLKRQLINEEYKCNDLQCTKVIDGTTYEIYYKEMEASIFNPNYKISLSQSIILNDNGNVCEYKVNDYTIDKKIDDSFTYNIQCSRYIDIVNEYIENITKIIEETDIDVNH